MAKLSEFEWGEGVTDAEGIALINLKDDNLGNVNQSDHVHLRQIAELGVDGYIDEERAFKIMDPTLSQKTKKLSINQHTLIEGDESMNDDKSDRNYSDLKEDLRESERRISNDIYERELRFEKTIDRFMIDAKEREERYIKTAEETKNIVYEGEKSRKSNTIAMWTLAVTTIIGIAAMVITVVLNVS